MECSRSHQAHNVSLSPRVEVKQNGLNGTDSWQRRTRRVRFCGTWSWVDRTGLMCKGMSLWQCSLKHQQKKIVSDNGTVFECHWQVLRWELRWIFITQWKISKSDLRRWRDNSALYLMPPLFESWLLWTSITFTTWCSLTVTIRCATIAGSSLVWTYSRVELKSGHFFSKHCLNEVFCRQRISWPVILNDNRCQQKFALKPHWLSKFRCTWTFL